MPRPRAAKLAVHALAHLRPTWAPWVRRLSGGACGPVADTCSGGLHTHVSPPPQTRRLEVPSATPILCSVQWGPCLVWRAGKRNGWKCQV